MTTQKERRTKSATVTGANKVGYAVALCLKPDCAPLRCYVGQVQEVDQRGIRLTLVDWLVGEFSEWDFFIPWGSIASALVATPEHDLGRFGDAAATFQTRCNYMAKGEQVVEQALRNGREEG